MSDYSNDYEQSDVLNDVVVDETLDLGVPDVSPEPEVPVTDSYEIKDGEEVIAAQNMAGAVNYDLIILIILIVAIVGGAIFFALKQRQQHQQVPTSEPQDEDAEAQLADTKVADDEKIVDTQEQL